MNNDIAKLLGLQKIDYEIYSLEADMQDKPKLLEAIESDFNLAKEDLSQVQEDLKQLELQQKEKEIELNSKEEEIKKYQAQLYQVKTNKEYSSLQHEIDSVKADNSILEEDIIILLDKVDEQKKVISDRKKDITELEDKLKEKKREIELDLKQIQQRIDALGANRKVAIQDIDKQVLEDYERVLENRKGNAMSKIVNSSCEECYMNLPPQMENEVRLGKIVICQNCSRILYMEDD